MPTDYSLDMSHLGKEENTILQRILLVFGFRECDIIQSKILIGKPKLVQAYDDSDNNSNHKKNGKSWILITSQREHFTTF